MKTLCNVSSQVVSWVQSNKTELQKSRNQIKHLYYPESLSELKTLVKKLNLENNTYDIIGYSSNTLFLPSYTIENLICTKKLNKWYETENEIVCECGVNVSVLSRTMVQKGYVGFEGLTDLPGTIAAGVYGNAGCRHCSVNELLYSFDLLTPLNEVKTLTVEDLNLEYRSSSLKRKELKGIILEVRLKKIKGNADELLQIAKKNHEVRLMQQPSPANNLGTTFIGHKLSQKGLFLKKLEKLLQKIIRSNDTRKSFPLLLRLIGKGAFSPYVYYWNRYMFLDEKSHNIFPKYCTFIQSLYLDAKLEIEVRK